MDNVIQFPSRDVQMEFIDSLNDEQLEVFLEIVRTTMAELDNLNLLYLKKCKYCKRLQAQIKNLKEKMQNEN